MNIGRVALHFGQQRGGPEQEKAAVPQMAAILNEAPRRLLIRLFDEPLDLADGACDLASALFDVAVAGLGRGWLDAEGDEPARCGCRNGGAHSLGEIGRASCRERVQISVVA